MKYIMLTSLFLFLGFLNEIFGLTAPACEIKNSSKLELNKALGIGDPNAPVFFIVVTRFNPLGGPLPLITVADWNNVLNVLEDICNDNHVINHLNAVPFNVAPFNNNLLNYIQSNMHELRNSCKIVVFSEYFCGRGALTGAQYNNFINGGAGYNGLLPFSNTHTKTVLYQHFLYSEAYNPLNANHVNALNTYNLTTNNVRDYINNYIFPAAPIVNQEGAVNLLTNLANALTTPGAGPFPGPAIVALATALGVGPLPHPAGAAQLAGALMGGGTAVAPAAIAALMAPAAALWAALNAGPINALTIPGMPANQLARITRLSLDLNAALPAPLPGGVGGTAFLVNNFANIVNSANVKRTFSSSIMLPLNAAGVQFITRNITQSICRNAILTQYKKRAYFMEDDNNVGIAGNLNLGTSIYDFGKGCDERVNMVPGMLQDIQNALLKSIAVEICFDLAKGVRHSNGWHNLDKQSDFLILQSNTIDPIGRKYEDVNINHLPRSSNGHNVYIVHADASDEPPAGSHVFKINDAGAPILCKEEKEKANNNSALIDFNNGIKITVYRLD